MNAPVPNAKSAGKANERRKLARMIASQGLCGLANDTKWNELLLAMRSQSGWKPAFRYKCIDGPPSTWDREWYYHPPFPMMSVEWLDIATEQTLQDQRLPLSRLALDHSGLIVDLLGSIGLEFTKGSRTIRIFGYSPKNMDMFDL